MTRLGRKAVQNDYLHAEKHHRSAGRIDGGGAEFLFLFVTLWTRRPREKICWYARTDGQHVGLNGFPARLEPAVVFQKQQPAPSERAQHQENAEVVGEMSQAMVVLQPAQSKPGRPGRSSRRSGWLGSGKPVGTP